MRHNQNVQPGQLWRSSDPRRLRLIEVLEPDIDGRPYGLTVTVRVLYPPPSNGRRYQTIPFRAFLTTGTKGLVRVS